MAAAGNELSTDERVLAARRLPVTLEKVIGAVGSILDIAAPKQIPVTSGSS